MKQDEKLTKSPVFDAAGSPVFETPSGPGGFTAFLRSSLVLGGLLTVLFYQLIPFAPLHRDLLERYFCSHPLEIATTALFFIGLVFLFGKLLRTMTDKTVLADEFLGLTGLAQSGDPKKNVARIQRQIGQLSYRMRDTHLVRRLGDVCAYIRGRKSSQGLEEHLKYLADLASQRMHESYAPVRTITWAVPIIGFLGTVVGITIAVANVTPEQLDTSLSEVTGGLAVAFDTTALALTLSVVLVFSTFFVERREQRVLSEVEDFGLRRIVPLFPPVAEAAGPLAEAEVEAAEILLKRSEALIDRQTELWQESLEGLRERWTETLERQSTRLNEALQQGTAATLADHSRQLAEVREQFLHSAEQIRELMTRNLQESREAQRQQQQEFRDALQQLWQLVHSDVGNLQQQQKEQVEQLVESLAGHVGAWQTLLNRTAETGHEQLEELRRQREVLLQVIGEEKELARLQTRLTDNLEAIRASENFEKTLLSLSAAVNLLTARARSSAA